MPELADDGYDWRAVEARLAPPPVRRPPTTRRGSMVLSATLLAVGEALDPKPREPIVEESPDPGLDPSLPVIVHLVRGQPRLSYALIRDAG